MSDTILGGDFTVYYLADNNRKQIKWSGTATGTRTVNQLYSALQDLFDELGQIDDGTPMSAQTPTEYTIGAIDASDIVPWFIDDETIQHLTGGAIKTQLWTRITTLQPGIVRVRCSANASIVYADVGNTINNGTAYGILVDMQGSGANTILFIRPTDSAYSATTAAAYASGSDWSGASATITCNAHTATSFATVTQVAQTGESLWANIYSLGSLTVDTGNNPTSDLYVYKNGTKVLGWTSGAASSYQWWPSGHIDILMKVKEPGANMFAADAAITGTTTVTLTTGNTTKLRVGQPVFGTNIMTGTTINTIASITGLRTFTLTNAGTNGTGLSIYTNTIDGSYVTVFNREYDNTYDYFNVDLNSGGRNPIPLATGDDLNNHTGTRTLTASAGAGTFSAGEIAYVGTWGSSVTAKAVITAVSGTGATSVISYYPIGNLTDFTGGVQTVTGRVSAATITNGAVANNAAATNPATLTGLSIVSAIGGYNDDINNGLGTNYYAIKIDPGVNTYTLAKVYEWTKYVTRRGSVDTSNNNGINGEQYIGVDYKLSYTALTGGQMASGAVVFQAATGASGVVMTHDTTQKHIIIRNSRGSFGTGAITDGTNSTDAGTTAASKTPIKPNPYGTFAGGKFFAAYAVMFNRANLNSADIQAYQLVSIDGRVQVPPNIIYVTITGLTVGDAAGVFRTTSSVINKAAYTTNVTAVAATSVVVSTAIGTDEPQAGYIRARIAMGSGIFQEHRYRYASWATSTFTLATVTTGQGAALTAAAATVVSGNLIDVTLGTAISTSEVQVGDMVYVYATGVPGTALDYGYVVKIVSTTDIQVRCNSGVVTQWTGVGNHIAFNQVVKAIAGTDTLYVPIIDKYVSTGTTVSNSLIYGTDINILARVRQYKNIIPFEQLATVGSTGLTISTVRTSDTIAT
jgi:hypothetical protein